MKIDIKYYDEFNFINDFANEFENQFGALFQIDKFKKVGDKEIDLFITDRRRNRSYAVEVKGFTSSEFLPPEIIPWLKRIKNQEILKINNLIVLSMANVSPNVKRLFENNGIHVFNYERAPNSLHKFKNYLDSLAELH